MRVRAPRDEGAVGDKVSTHCEQAGPCASVTWIAKANATACAQTLCIAGGPRARAGGTRTCAPGRRAVAAARLAKIFCHAPLQPAVGIDLGSF